MKTGKVNYPKCGVAAVAGNSSNSSQIQIKRLEAQIASLTKLVSLERNLAAERAAQAEQFAQAMTVNLGRLVAVMQDQKDTPFGLRLGFVQGTLQSMNIMAQIMRDDRSRDTSKDFEKFGAIMVERSRPDWKPGKK